MVEQAVILAGGLATRMHPFTLNLAKSMLPVMEQPFVAHQLRLLQRNGIKRVLMCLGHLGEQVVAFVGTGSQFDIEVTYSFDGIRPLGTAGAICNALSELDEAFFLTYGDSYLPFNYERLSRHFHDSDLLAMMAVYHNMNAHDKSNVGIIDGKIVAYDKSNETNDLEYIDYGITIYRRAVFENLLCGSPIDLSSVAASLIAVGQLGAFEVEERFYEIGSPIGYQQLTKYLQGRLHSGSLGN